MKTVVAAICLYICSWGAVDAYTIKTSARQTAAQLSTGYFGGVVRNGVLRLIRSQQGGILFFRISLPFTITYRHQVISLSDLPLQTPITVLTEEGRVLSVEVTE